MIIVLTEERSMVETVRFLMETHRPDLAEGLDWFVFAYNGKSDLEKNIVTRMTQWNYGDPQFLILRDADGGDCRRIKRELSILADSSGRRYKVRIVCQELESWFLGDPDAVIAAFPRCRFSNKTAAYRNPDLIGNASEELARLTGDRTKVGRARLIAPHLDPSRNCSHSFQLFLRLWLPFHVDEVRQEQAGLVGRTFWLARATAKLHLTPNGSTEGRPPVVQHLSAVFRSVAPM